MLTRPALARHGLRSAAVACAGLLLATGCSTGAGEQVSTASTSSRSSSTTSRPTPPPVVTETRTATAAATATATPSEPSVTARTTALPVYLVGRTGGGDRLGLFREFQRTQVAPDVTTRTRAAVEKALRGTGSDAAYLRLWGDVHVTRATVTPGLITLTLSGAGPTQPAEPARLGFSGSCCARVGWSSKE